MKTLHFAEPGGRARFAGNRRRARGLLMLVAGVAIALVMTPAGAPAQGPANPAPLQTPQPQGSRTIQVTGSGEAHVAPDVASLNLAIETHAPTAQQSAGQNAALAQKVVDALTTKLEGKGKVWTGGYSLYPEYNEPRPNEKPAVTGYRAENSITVETGEIGMLGGLIDTAIDAGANRINFLNFTLRDESQARSQAIALAAKDAQAQAESLAKSLGVKLGPVVKATTEAENRPMPVMRMGAMAMSASMGAPTPVQPNEVTVPATVSITYQIE
ncbi:MAG TPA: SIMPL domain-containing protein [Candidatus Binataceae bacterium]|nr:SIMPL domain-containing protein [Candidatus Binataceae bacterium]